MLQSQNHQTEEESQSFSQQNPEPRLTLQAWAGLDEERTLEEMILLQQLNGKGKSNDGQKSKTINRNQKIKQNKI